ncbi:MAG: CHAD domain-containing protein, partial [Acidimicrobiia bacterium]|nr:CHAD domain-containing protein [Acidimicrobiia bacterium]
NETVRDAGRVLSEARDAAVLVMVFDAVEVLTRPVAPAIRASLVELAAEKRGAVTSATIEGVIDSLGDTRERVEAWPVPLVHGDDGFGLISPGLRRVYRRGRRRMAHAIADGTAEAFHQWRKPAKHLFYQLEILQFGCASEAPVLVQPAKELAEVLGEEHDLAVLHDTIDTLGAGSARMRSTVLGQIDECRRQVQAVASELGDSLFAAPPRDFISRLGGLWAASRDDGTAG